MGAETQAKSTPDTAAAKKIEAETQDEIEKIMNEIEELQLGMGPDAGVQSKVSTPVSTQSQAVSEHSSVDEEVDSVLKEFQAEAGQEPAMEETLSGLADEEPRGPTILDEVVSGGGVHAAVAEHSREEGSMDHQEDGTLTMTLTGNMKLKLKYEFDGQEVTIGFTDQSLYVRLSDGTEFKVPVRMHKGFRKVA